jgi:hypothetical protein
MIEDQLEKKLGMHLALPLDWNLLPQRS